jgi:hypothetical protein
MPPAGGGAVGQACLEQRPADDDEHDPARRIAGAAQPHHPGLARHAPVEVAEEVGLGRLDELPQARPDQDRAGDEQEQRAAGQGERGRRALFGAALPAA